MISSPNNGEGLLPSTDLIQDPFQVVYPSFEGIFGPELRWGAMVIPGEKGAVCSNPLGRILQIIQIELLNRRTLFQIIIGYVLRAQVKDRLAGPRVPI